MHVFYKTEKNLFLCFLQINVFNIYAVIACHDCLQLQSDWAS